MIAGYRLRCDSCRKAWITVDAADVPLARKQATSNGWDSFNDRDICPRCAYGKGRP